MELLHHGTPAAAATLAISRASSSVAASGLSMKTGFFAATIIDCYDEMLTRARDLLPAFAGRAADCEKQRRLTDDNERDLHRTGLFRVLQPASVGGAELDVGIIVDICAEIAKVCPSTSWNFGNLASHHWMLGYFDPDTQDEIWDVSPDTLIATSLAFPGGRGAPG